MTLVLKRTADQQAALDRLLEEQRDPFSPNYRKWLSPEEFGQRFGLGEDDFNRVVSWLQSQGFNVDATARGRSWIVFSATAAQAEAAFHTEIHRYQEGPSIHYAAAAPPSIPAELEPLIASVRGLDNYYWAPPGRPFRMANLKNGSHALAPGDLAAIYGFTPGGQGQTIAVMGQSAINLADIDEFRSNFQLPPNDPVLMLIGDDPGVDGTGPQQEADADLEWAGAVAPDATIIYVYAQDVRVATQAAIDQNVAPIISLSYGTCEAYTSSGDATLFQDLAQQANAQGITWVASSGDAGAAACDVGDYPAAQGLAVSFPASLPEVTGVGGTEFNDSNGNWNGSNAANLSSAIGYIPETGWDDTTSALGLLASGGGASSLFAQPSWQTGLGVPDNGARNVPDLAIDASPEHDPYLVITNQNIYTEGGTSIAAPVFAGMLALTEQSIANNVGSISARPPGWPD